MNYHLNGRPVENISVAGINRRDHPEYADAHAESAVWGDTGEALSEDELEQLTLDPDLMDELIQSHLQGEADHLHDLMTNR